MRDRTHRSLCDKWVRCGGCHCVVAPVAQTRRRQGETRRSTPTRVRRRVGHRFPAPGPAGCCRGRNWPRRWRSPGGRQRMDTVIAAAIADVEAMGFSTGTPQSKQALIRGHRTAPARPQGRGRGGHRRRQYPRSGLPRRPPRDTAGSAPTPRGPDTDVHADERNGRDADERNARHGRRDDTPDGRGRGRPRQPHAHRRTAKPAATGIGWRYRGRSGQTGAGWRLGADRPAGAVAGAISARKRSWWAGGLPGLHQRHAGPSGCHRPGPGSGG